MRTGILAKKLGMSSLYDSETGEVTPVTLLLLDQCQVVQSKVNPEGASSYGKVQLGVGEVKAKNLTKPVKGHYAKNNAEPAKILVEFPVSEEGMLASGQKVTVNHFVTGQYVDVRAETIGKGFAGAMKRWNFGGLRATHGVSVSHRSHGSTGQRQDPGRTFKGKKMAGHMGNTNVTVQNLKVVGIDEAKSLIIVKGAIPGAKNTYVQIRDAKKKALPTNAPYPTALGKAQANQNNNEPQNEEGGSNES